MKFLVVDDEKSVTRLMSRILSNLGYECDIAYNGTDAISLFEKEKYPIVFLDFKLPDMNGKLILDRMKEIFPESQIIIFSGELTTEDCLAMDISDFISKPIEIEAFPLIIKRSLKLFNLLMKNREESIEKDNVIKSQINSLQMALEASIHALSQTTELKCPYTGSHQKNVALLTTYIAKQMGFSKDRIQALRYAGLIHDLGKISVPSSILAKPSKLSNAEMTIIREHVNHSYRIAKEIPFDSILGVSVANIVVQHHERLDGSGYPNGISNNAEFLNESKILSVADIVDAMINHRPYRPALTIRETIDTLQKAVKDNQLDKVAVGEAIRWLKNKRE